jgi:hypothetical protein
MKISVATMEISMEALNKLKIELPDNPAIPLMSMYLKDCKSAYNRDYLHTQFKAKLGRGKPNVCPQKR